MCDYVVDPVWCGRGPLGPLTRTSASKEGTRQAVPAASPSNACSGEAWNSFAPALAALTDHEEMVLALVHPVVQVYTIPRTGQLAYVGHICKFGQKVS